MIVRICLLVLLAVAVATGCATPGDLGDVTSDRQAQLAELGVEDAVIARVIEVPRPLASMLPALVRGTELEPPAPLAGRVFRPPRLAFG
jgi:hypothetical protein